MTGNPKRSIDPAITAAIITVIGGIVIALLPNFINRPSSGSVQPTPVLPTAVIYTDTVAPTAMPTDTVPAGEPTSTPEPPTFTPEPLPTATLIPAGADWEQNCISSVWLPYPSSAGVTSDDKGCWKQPVNTFYTSAGELAFVFDERVSGKQTYGMFTQLPSDGTASLNVHLLQVIKGSVLVGVFESPDPDSKGALLVMPPGKGPDEQIMQLVKTPDKGNVFAQSEPIASPSATYDIYFDFTSGNVNVKLRNQQVNLGTVPVVSADKWLFVGYEVANGTNTLQAEFSDLLIQTR